MPQLQQQKQTERFEETIRQFLTRQGQKDPAFLKHCCEVKQRLGKNTTDCCTYIINQVKNTGRCGFTDDEIFSLAMHYWDEENVEVGNRPQCQIVLNQEIKLSDEEIEECKKEARERLIKEQMNAMRTKNTPQVTKKPEGDTMLLF
ncbi:MAG: PcfK-like protein [Paludibacteraceae bacterium]|nr:PcfK-like protein [Paludibacteraceae bacterium]